VIHVRRGTEPPSLARAGTKGMASAIQAHTRHGPGSDELAATLKGYDASGVKNALYLMQHKKCVWCERRRDQSSSPIEHYRPKDGAWRHRREEPRTKIDAGHYWWLTWSWTNLYFACGRCNDKGHKGNYFRLEAGTKPPARPPRKARAPLPQKYFDLASERPLLIHPAEEDPMDHIAWRPVDKGQPRNLWTWSPKGLTSKGNETIFDLKLDELADEVGDEIRRGVLRGIEEIDRYLAAGDSVAARDRWNTLLADELSPGSSLSAAKWCALELWMPSKTRRLHGLASPVRPG